VLGREEKEERKRKRGKGRVQVCAEGKRRKKTQFDVFSFLPPSHSLPFPSLHGNKK
jgi:hypothetical protein